MTICKKNSPRTHDQSDIFEGFLNTVRAPYNDGVQTIPDFLRGKQSGYRPDVALDILLVTKEPQEQCVEACASKQDGLGELSRWEGLIRGRDGNAPMMDLKVCRCSAG